MNKLQCISEDRYEHADMNTHPATTNNISGGEQAGRTRKNTTPGDATETRTSVRPRGGQQSSRKVGKTMKMSVKLPRGAMKRRGCQLGP